ncbi:hypothetical protein Cantr_10201 [Candida viswanathii]|uniref:RNase III domain-containing protein n=1 Tax=Candida viswanathii TaxID=5486 RepID=A0A367YCS8_9ASCO|nr:hypothetical protein Cantr_10201 [Candida viswanathii]
MFIRHSSRRLRHSTTLLHRHLSTVPLLANDLYIERLEIAAKRTPNHRLRQDTTTSSSSSSSNSPFPGSRVRRDAIDGLDPWLRLDSTSTFFFETKSATIQSYIAAFGLALSPSELLCVAYGLTEMLVTIGNHRKNSVYCTSTLRALGRLRFRFCLLRSTIFVNERYLTASEVEVREDIAAFVNNEVVYEFLKWNGLHLFSLLNRELLILKDLPNEEFKEKKAMLWEKTAIGSFYTMLGILLVKYDEARVNDLITNKIITGKRGIIDIVQLKQLG